MMPHALNLRTLDSLRGALAVYVLFGHARWLLWAGFAAWVQVPHEPWQNALAYASAAFRYGHEAVMVFFVLSGFFIHLRAAQRIAQGKDVALDAAGYFVRRAHRILPPYVLALMVTVVLDSIGNHFFPVLYRAQTGDALLDLNFAWKGYDSASIIPALFAVPKALGRDFGTNGPLWSLAYEVVFYSIYPLWLRLRRYSSLAAYLGVPAVCLALSGLETGGFPLRVMMSYPIWLSGAGLAEMLLRKPLKLGGLVSASVGGAVAFALFQITRATAARTIMAAVFGCAAAALLLGLPGKLSGQRWHRLLEMLGLRSYTIYIMHFPILALMSAALLTHRGSRPLSGYIAVAGALLSLLMCCALFQICERRFLHPRIRAEAPAPHPETCDVP